MLEIKALKQKLSKKWLNFTFHKTWLSNESLFPYRVPLSKLTDKQLLHGFTELHLQLGQFRAGLCDVKDVTVIEQEFQFATMGRQRLPIAVEFANIEALTRFLGCWQQWQAFVSDVERLQRAFPALMTQLGNAAPLIDKYQGRWPELIAVCQFFLTHPRPGVYIRQLDIPGIDSKFIEVHKSILKTLLDNLLAESDINHHFQSLSEHGFEQRFGLRYELPQVRFRLLDPMLSAELGGLRDLTIPIDEFAKLDLLLDRVFITENKVNGLAFPPVKNALVVFGLGYGVQMLKQVSWLNDCQILYWGDIDSHGFAILSQLRGYFPHTRSLLMDEMTLLQCRDVWGEEPANHVHSAAFLPQLSENELQLYQQIKSDHWQVRLRLEQERIPFRLLELVLQTM